MHCGSTYMCEVWLRPELKDRIWYSTIEMKCKMLFWGPDERHVCQLGWQTNSTFFFCSRSDAHTRDTCARGITRCCERGTWNLLTCKLGQVSSRLAQLCVVCPWKRLPSVVVVVHPSPPVVWLGHSHAWWVSAIVGRWSSLWLRRSNIEVTRCSRTSTELLPLLTASRKRA